jgi:molybdopterin synthase catalytic subunit
MMTDDERNDLLQTRADLLQWARENGTDEDLREAYAAYRLGEIATKEQWLAVAAWINDRSLTLEKLETIIEFLNRVDDIESAKTFAENVAEPE